MVNLASLGPFDIPTANLRGKGSSFITSDHRGAAILLSNGQDYMLAFRGTDAANDVVSWLDVMDGSYLRKFVDLLHAIEQDLGPSAQLTVTGHSLGGWLANHIATDLGASGGVWGQATYIGFESMITSPGVFNFGNEADSLYKLLAPLSLGLGTDRLWFDNGHTLFAGHSKEAVVETVQRLETSPFSAFMSFTDNYVIRTSGALATNFSLSSFIKASGTTSNYDSSRDVFVLGNALDEVIRLDLDASLRRYADAGAGNDAIQAQQKVKDMIMGGVGVDTFNGGLGNDTLSGDGLILDYKRGTLTIADIVPGLSLAHSLYVGQQGTGDLIDGRTLIDGGDDQLIGGDGSDILFGADGNDKLVGGGGNDVLIGGGGDDTLFGGDGDDTLNIGGGSDLEFGGAGNDIYIMNPLFQAVDEDAASGVDSVIVTNNGLVFLSNVEVVALAGGVESCQIKVSQFGQLAVQDISFVFAGNEGSDAVTFDFPGAGTGGLAFFGGGGSDTFTFKQRPPIGTDAHFLDISSNDHIDLTAMLVKGVIANATLDLTDSVAEPNGLFLLSSAVQVMFRAASGVIQTQSILKVLHTDSDWLLVDSQNDRFQVVADLYGAMGEHSFLIWTDTSGLKPQVVMTLVGVSTRGL